MVRGWGGGGEGEGGEASLAYAALDVEDSNIMSSSSFGLKTGTDFHILVRNWVRFINVRKK